MKLLLDLKKQKKLADKFNKLEQKTGFNYTSFPYKVIPSVVGWYFSTPNFNRELEVGKNERDTSRYLNNVFIRPKFDMSRENEDYSFYLKGTVKISTDRYGNNTSSFIAKDIILTKNYPASQYFEEVIICDTDFISEEKKSFESYEGNILTHELLKDIPFIVAPDKLKEFLNLWDNYLDFEKALFSRNMVAYKIDDYEIISVAEIIRTLENEELFADDIIHKTEALLYVSADSSKLKGYEETYDVIKISLNKDQIENINRLKNFIRENLGIISERSLTVLNKMRENEHLEDDDKIRAIYLGETIFFKENKDKYEIIKFIIDDEIQNLENKINRLGQPIYLANLATGEIALYKRGKEALRRLESGDIKNPLIAAYLLEPEKFNNAEVSNGEISFTLKHLDNSQRQAINQALNSDSIFLIQGPPGTGKTQVITELVYQYIKRGNKVLLSSQTHLAIDNVLERLPNDLDILPIRLVNETRKQSQYFLPDKLIDNLYNNIEKKYKSRIKEFENFVAEIRDTEHKYQEILGLKQKIEEKRKEINDLESQKDNLMSKKFSLTDEISSLEVELKDLEKKKRLLEQILNNNYTLDEVWYENITYDELLDSLKNLLKKYNISIEGINSLKDALYKISKIAGKKRKEEIEKALGKIKELPKELIKINKEIEEKEKAIEVMKKSGIPEESIKIIIKQINELLKKKKEIENKTGIKIQSNRKDLIFYFNINNKSIEQELERLVQFNNDLKEILKKYINKQALEEIKTQKKEIEETKIKTDNEATKIDIEIQKLESEIQKLKKPIKSDLQKIENYFNEFFTDKSKLDDNSIPGTDEEKLEKIRAYIDQEKNRLKEFEHKYRKLENIYKSVMQHLNKKDEFIDKDRELFTKDLFDKNANIYGVTCTASPKFKESKHEYLKQLGLGDVSLLDEDFDVVIIDEVSKATPIELLIPILYGKKIVLVGDHRQLPPIFKYRESNLKDLSDEERAKILKDKELRDYKNLVETSFFETIFSKLTNNKATLTKQYRFHEQIMKCVNVFYDDLLEMGLGKEQNNRKQHNLEITIQKDNKQIPIIVKNAHTYWFDSSRDIENLPFYERRNEGETSLYNPLEAHLTFELIKLIDKTYGELKKKDYEAFARSIGDNKFDRPTVGIISMYGKHVGYIKKLFRENKYKPENIILFNSTVDDYQGKENDIIILNFVRHNTKKVAGEFIRKFNRINVAISRARNLLIIIGAKEFVNNLMVDIPDIKTGEIKRLSAYQFIYERTEKKLNNAAHRFEIKLKN